MSKFYGKIGYNVSAEREGEPGVYDPGPVERTCYGELLRTEKTAVGSDKVNQDIDLRNELSIIANPFAINHFSDILYVEYMGVKWKVTGVEVKFPRLILTTGSVYNG